MFLKDKASPECLPEFSMRGEPDLLYLYGETWDGNKAEEFRKGRRKNKKNVCYVGIFI